MLGSLWQPSPSHLDRTRRSSLSRHSLTYVNWLYVKEVACASLCFATEHHTAVPAISMWSLAFVLVELTNCGSILLHPDLSSIASAYKNCYLPLGLSPSHSPLPQPEFYLA